MIRNKGSIGIVNLVKTALVSLSLLLTSNVFKINNKNTDVLGVRLADVGPGRVAPAPAPTTSIRSVNTPAPAPPPRAPVVTSLRQVNDYVPPPPPPQIETLGELNRIERIEAVSNLNSGKTTNDVVQEVVDFIKDTGESGGEKITTPTTSLRQINEVTPTPSDNTPNPYKEYADIRAQEYKDAQQEYKDAQLDTSVYNTDPYRNTSGNLNPSSDPYRKPPTTPSLSELNRIERNVETPKPTLPDLIEKVNGNKEDVGKYYQQTYGDGGDGGDPYTMFKTLGELGRWERYDPYAIKTLGELNRLERLPFPGGEEIKPIKTLSELNRIERNEVVAPDPTPITTPPQIKTLGELNRIERSVEQNRLENLRIKDLIEQKDFYFLQALDNEDLTLRDSDYQLEEYIYDAAALIRAGDYKKSITMLSDKEAAKSFGITLDKPNPVYMPRLKFSNDRDPSTPDVNRTQFERAQMCLFTYLCEGKETAGMVTSYGSGDNGPSITLPNKPIWPINTYVPDVLYLEIAEASLEEWSHALQQTYTTVQVGRPQFVGNYQEQEIGYFMAKYLEVPLTSLYVERKNLEEFGVVPDIVIK